ncbi:hypothetical protein BV22DRAFT_1117214 [Leucogyrophana mollusca]|uniref:Uncharacterized protein n=1 Tax=Leucogyrophana mollusca TaxID=85980 RepID=A0ACB8BV30_9AGAM|nr:hypothetical protein BV22DRAFT_1117214 [Leucogyrophana mollusca]
MIAVQSPVDAFRKVEPKLLPKGAHLWKIDDNQCDRISTLLDIDFAAIDLRGHVLNTAESVCHGCGKLSGLDDFVSTGLSRGVHTKEFIINSLTGPHRSSSTPHELECCVCGTVYLDRYRIDKEEGKALRKRMADSGYNPRHEVGAAATPGWTSFERWERPAAEVVAEQTTEQTTKNAPGTYIWNQRGEDWGRSAYIWNQRGEDWGRSAKEVATIEQAEQTSEGATALYQWTPDQQWERSALDVAAIEQAEKTSKGATALVEWISDQQWERSALDVAAIEQAQRTHEDEPAMVQWISDEWGRSAKDIAAIEECSTAY